MTKPGDISNNPTAPSLAAVNQPRPGEYRAPPKDPTVLLGVKAQSREMGAVFEVMNRMIAGQQNLADHLHSNTVETKKLAGEVTNLKGKVERVEQTQQTQPVRYLSPYPSLQRITDVPPQPVSLKSPPVCNPDNPGDVLIAVRPRAESIPDGESDDERIARIERDAQARADESNTQYASLSSIVDGLREEIKASRRAAPEVAKVAANQAAQAATTAAKSELTTILTNRNFTGMVIAGITAIGGIIGAGAYAGHQAKQGSKEATQQQAATIEHAAREGAKEAKQEGPSVFIVNTEGELKRMGSGPPSPAPKGSK